MAADHVRDVVIVGNGVAGYACAARLAKNGVRPLLVGPGLPTDRPQLSKRALRAGIATPYGDARTLRERGIDLLDGLVVEVDAETRTVRVDIEGRTLDVHAGTLVVATGLRYGPPPVAGLDQAHVLGRVETVAALAENLADAPKRIFIVGGGLIGVEAAATLALGGHAVTVGDVLATPLERLHPPISDLAADTLGALGVEFVGGLHIESACRESDGGWTIATRDHDAFHTDVVCVATGGAPAPPPGLEGEFPALVDESMQLTPDVYAIGDLVVPPHSRFGRVRLPHWDIAIGTANRAADAILGLESGYDRIPYWWSDIGPRRLSEVGVAAAACEWRQEDGLHLGRDAEGSIVCVLAVDAPQRLREAQRLLAV